LPKFRGIEPKLIKITMREMRYRLLFQSLSEVGLYFGPEARKWAFKKFCCVLWQKKERHSRVSLASLGLENIPQVPVNQAEVAQNYDAPKAISATLSVLKWSGVIFLSRRSKVSVQKVLLSAFHCKPKRSKVSLESPGLENIPQVPGKWPDVDQNHDARNAVSATVSVL